MNFLIVNILMSLLNALLTCGMLDCAERGNPYTYSVEFEIDKDENFKIIRVSLRRKVTISYEDGWMDDNEVS